MEERIMKRLYNQPCIKVVKVQSLNILAASTLGVGGDNGKGVVLGREDNSWDIWGSGEDEE